MTINKYPKMLPWLARKAKISDKRAEDLWHEAVCDVILRKSLVENHHYPDIFQRLHELFEQEKDEPLSGQRMV